MWAGWHRSVCEVLTEARGLGLLGPGPVERHVVHALGFVDAWRWAMTGGAGRTGGNACSGPGASAGREPGDGPCLAIDLGSGAGVPGLVLAAAWPSTTVILLEGGERRATFLGQAVDRLELRARVHVVAGRAEVVGREEEHRGRYDAVFARSFGPPGVTAECGAPFLHPGGLLIASEPPERSPEGTRTVRWPVEGLALLGMREVGLRRDDAGYQVIQQVSRCPGRYPRRDGVPAKRPLF